MRIIENVDYTCMRHSLYTFPMGVYIYDGIFSMVPSGFWKIEDVTECYTEIGFSCSDFMYHWFLLINLITGNVFMSLSMSLF